ncbi:MAG TPA: hypothetical protein VFG13_18170 [Blastococcus sp.]|nr:hypothetical protein [Blastococcus sp.]
METAVATPAQDLSAPIALRDVEDLHEADLDGVLTDALMDAGVAATTAGALAGLVGRGPGAEAVLAHTLSSRALFLALL